MIEHSFNTFIAEKYGVFEAIFIKNMVLWTANNSAKQSKKSDGSLKHFHEGRWWVFGTKEFFCNYLPYFTPNQIRRLLERCVSKGLLINGNFNQYGFDKTNWYSLSNLCLSELNLDVTCRKPAPSLIGQNCPMGEADSPDLYHVHNHIQNNKKQYSSQKEENGLNDNDEISPVPQRVEVGISKDTPPFPSQPEVEKGGSGETRPPTKEVEEVISVWNKHATNAGCPKVGNNKRQLKTIHKNIQAIKKKWDVAFSPETFEIMLEHAISKQFYLLTKYYQSLDVFLRWNNFEAAYQEVKGGK